MTQPAVKTDRQITKNVSKISNTGKGNLDAQKDHWDKKFTAGCRCDHPTKQGNTSACVLESQGREAQPEVRLRQLEM